MADMTNKDEQGFDAALDSYFGFFDEEEDEPKKENPSGEKTGEEQADEKAESSDEPDKEPSEGGEQTGASEQKDGKKEQKPEEKKASGKDGKETGKDTGDKAGTKTGEKTGKNAGKDGKNAGKDTKDGKSTGKGKDSASKIVSKAETAYSLAQTKDEDTDSAREDQAEVGEGVAKEAASEHKDVTKKIIVSLTDAVKEETAEAGEEGAEKGAEHAGKEKSAVGGENGLSPDEGMEHEHSLDTPDLADGAETDTVQVDGTDVRLEDGSDLFSQPEAQQDYDRRSAIYGQEYGQEYGSSYGTETAETSVTGASGISQGGAGEESYATSADTLLAGQGQTDTVQVDGMNVRLEEESNLFSQPEAQQDYNARSAIYGQETQFESGAGSAYAGSAETPGSVTGATGISYGPAAADHSTASAETLLAAQGSLAGGALDGEEREISRTYHGHEASKHLYVNGVNVETGEMIHARGEGITSDVPVRILAGNKAAGARVPGAGSNMPGAGGGEAPSENLVNLNGTDVRLEENPAFFTEPGAEAGAGERSRLFGQDVPHSTGGYTGQTVPQEAAGRVIGASGITYGPETMDHSAASADTLLAAQGNLAGTSPQGGNTGPAGQAEEKRFFRNNTGTDNGMIRMPGAAAGASPAAGQALPDGYIRVNGEPVRLEEGVSLPETEGGAGTFPHGPSGQETAYPAGSYAGQAMPQNAAGRVTGASGITYEQTAETISAGSAGVLLNAQGQTDGTALPGSGTPAGAAGQRPSANGQTVSGAGAHASMPTSSQTVSGYGPAGSSGHVRVNGRDVRLEAGAAMDGRQATETGAGRSSLNGQAVYGQGAPYGASPVTGRPVSGHAAGRVTGASGITYEQTAETISAGSAGVLLNAQGQTDGTALPGSGTPAGAAGLRPSAGGQTVSGYGPAGSSGHVRVNGRDVRLEAGAAMDGRQATETGAGRSSLNGQAVYGQGAPYGASPVTGRPVSGHAAGSVTGASGIAYRETAESLSAGSAGTLLDAQGQADGTNPSGSRQLPTPERRGSLGISVPAEGGSSSRGARVRTGNWEMSPSFSADHAGKDSGTLFRGQDGVTPKKPGASFAGISYGTGDAGPAAGAGAGSVRASAEGGKINGKAVSDKGRINGKAVSGASSSAAAGKAAGNKAVQGAQKTFGGMAGIIGATVSLGQTAHQRDRDRSGNESMPSLPGGGSSDADSLIPSGTSSSSGTASSAGMAGVSSVPGRTNGKTAWTGAVNGKEAGFGAGPSSAAGASSGMAGVSSVPGRTNGKAAWKGAVNGKEAVSGRDAVSSVTGHGITGNGSLAGIGEQGLAGAGSFSYNRATGRVRTYRADKLAGDAIAQSRSVSGRGIANAGERVSGGRTATGKAGGTLGAKAGKTAASGAKAGRGASGIGSSAGIVAGKKRSRAKIRSAEIHVSQTKHGLSQSVETEGIAGKKLAGQKTSATSLYLEQQRLKESPLLFTRDGQRTGHAARMEERLAGKTGTRSKTGSAMLKKRLADTKKKRMARMHVGKGRPIGRKRGPLSVSAEKQKEAERRLLKFQQANSTPAGSLLGASGGAGGAAGAAIVKRRMRAVAVKAAKKVLTASLISGIGLGVVVGGGAAAGKSSSSTFGTWYPLQANLTVGNTDGGTTNTATDTTTDTTTAAGTSYTQDAVTKMAARLAAYQSAAAGITLSGGDEVQNLKEIKISKKTVDGKEKPVGNLKLSDLTNASVVFQYIDKNGNIFADSSGSGTGSSSGSAADVSATGTAGAILAAAKSRVGGRYVWGQGVWGTGPSDCAMDCSHYVWQVLVHAIGYQGGYTTSTNWASRGKPVASLAQAQAGDIVVYSGHVAIYDGNGYIYEAKGSAYGITHDRRADHAPIIAIRRFIPDGATVTVNGSASSTSASSASTGVTTTATTTTTTTTTATTGKTITIPAGLGRYFTYERWQGVGAGGDAQQRLKEQAGMTFDAEGFGKINGRYVIACTTTFGSVGDLIDFYQSDGTVFHCIMGDAKSQADAGANQWGHQNGTNVIEFIVDQNTWYSHAGGHWAGNHGNPGEGSFHREWANKFITKAVNLGSYFNGATGSGGVSGGTGASGTSGSVMLMKEVLSMSAIGGYYKDPSDLKEYEQYCYDVIDYAVAKANGATVAYTTGSDTPTVTVRICCDMAKLEKNDKNFTDWDRKYDDGDQIPASYMALSDTDFNTIFNVSMSAFAGMSGGNSGGGQLTNAALAIYQYLAAKGVDDIHIAALLGNMAQESGGQKIESINPAAIQYPNTVGADGVPAKGGIGIIQWTGGRKTALVNFARSRGTNWTDVNTQMEFLWQEAHGSDSAAWNHFMAARTLEEATTTYCMYAEAGGPSTYNRYSATTFWVMQVRIAQAQHAYQLMQAGTLSANAGANAGTQGGTT